MVEEAESLAEKLATVEKNRDVLIKYWLTIGFRHLRAKNPAKCVLYLMKVKNVLETLKEVSSACINNARFWCLTCHFICLYPEYERELGLETDQDIRAVIYKAFGFISSGIKEEASRKFKENFFFCLLL